MAVLDYTPSPVKGRTYYRWDSFVTVTSATGYGSSDKTNGSATIPAGQTRYFHSYSDYSWATVKYYTLPSTTYQDLQAWTDDSIFPDQTTCTVTYNVNGGSGAPSNETITKGSYTISSTVPTRSMYNFLGWSYNGSTYQPGATINVSGNITLTASWSQPSVTTTTTTTYTASILREGMYYYAKFTPTVSAYYCFEGISSDGESADTYGYLYDASGSQTNSNDDGGDGSHFLITKECTAGTTYYIGVRYYNSSYTGNIGVRISRGYPVNKYTTGGSYTTVQKYHNKDLDLGGSDTSEVLATWTVWFEENKGGSVSGKNTSYKRYLSFSSWNTAANGTGTTISNNIYTSNAAASVYSQYTESSRAANAVTVSNPTWTDHVFLGWSTSNWDFQGAETMSSFTPTSDGQTLYAIWYVPKCYLKTESGWKLGRVFKKGTSDWEPNYKLYAKTADGWKQGYIGSVSYDLYLPGLLNGSSNETWSPVYNGYWNFDIMFDFMPTTTTDSTINILRLYYNATNRIECVYDSTTDALKFTRPYLTTATQTWSNVGLVVNEWNTIRIYGSGSSALRVVVNGTSKSFSATTSRWTATTNSIKIGDTGQNLRNITITSGRSSHTTISVPLNMGQAVSAPKGNTSLTSTVAVTGTVTGGLL